MDLLAGFALVSVVLVGAALAAGMVDRAPLSFPIVFLGLGLLLGPGAAGVVDVGLDDAIVEIVAITTLSLVLFLDAVHLDVGALRAQWWVPALTLGPGTVVTIGGVAGAAVLLLGWSWPLALIAGATLASTDAVTLRDVLRDERLPTSVRRSLAVEAGTNDVIVLPVLLVTIAVASGQTTGAPGWLLFAAQLLVFGPLAGAAVGGGGAWIMARVDRRTPIRLEYQSIFGVGLVLLAYVAGEAVGGSGFLAAFAAGLAVGLGNQALCDCFLDLGQVLVEVLLLAAFVLFGAVLSGLIGQTPLLPALALAAIALLVVRPVGVVGALTLRRTMLSPAARLVIGWFGPRGLASLLLALLAVRAGIPGAETLFAVVGVVVAVSVVVHGTTVGAVAGAYDRRHGDEVSPEDRDATPIGVLGRSDDDVPRIDAAELASLLAEDAAVVVDARAPSARRTRPTAIPDSRPISPDELAAAATGLPRDRVIVTWCTCTNDATAARSAATLRDAGLDARVLAGGLDAWASGGRPVVRPADIVDP